MTATEPHPALAHLCPFCGADPGQPCRTHSGQGRALSLPHARRLLLVDDWMRRRREPTTEQALCCECGNTRTYKKARNYLAERYDHQTWHRMTGDLKCTACGRTTRHALLRSGEFRDTAEDYQRVALGGQPADRLEDVQRARREYRVGLPRNPLLHHWYAINEAQAAWDAGQRTVTALCGDTMKLHRDPSEPATERDETQRSDDPIAPDDVDWDTEFEDPDTGLWWLDMDCVNCLQVANERRQTRRRRLLESWLAWFACKPETIPDFEADALIRVLSPLVRALREA